MLVEQVTVQLEGVLEAVAVDHLQQDQQQQ
jgi:hypothetical protein